MQSAKAGDRDIDAVAFEQLDAASREALKPQLRCGTCARPAFFVRRSRDGRAAHFSAQHEDGCGAASARDEEPPECGDLDEVPAISNSGDELRLRRDPARARSGLLDAGANGEGSVGRAGKTHRAERGETETHARSIGMSMLLQRLRTEPALSRSETVLVLHDGTRATIAETCSPASTFVLQEGRTQILWGLITAASMSGRNLWINTGDPGSKRPALLIRAPHIDEVLAAAGVTELAQLRGRWFIAEGQFKLTVNAAPYCTLEEPDALLIA